MIQPNELRIGNYVLDEGQVYEITLYDFYNYHEDSGITNQEPIPLTEEWLLRLGGLQDSLTPFINIDMPRNIGYISINPNNNIIWLKHHRADSSLNPGCIQFVHQLQNLHFALTGEELKVKEMA